MGFIRGFREAGADPVPLDPSLGGWVEAALKLALVPRYPSDSVRHPGRSLLFAETGPELVRLRSRVLGRRLAGAARLDALLVFNGLVVPPVGVPAVTYDDMTIPLALEYGYPHWRALPRRAVTGRMRLTAELYRRATACCTGTLLAADSLVREYRVPSAKVHVIGIGRSHEPLVRERDWSKPRFLFVGRDFERKGGPIVLAAFRRVRELRPEATLDIVGKHPPLDVPGVTGHGPVHGRALEELFATATCFVMVAEKDAGGIAYTEAGAAGIPSIGTTGGAASEMIGRGGRTIDPRDLNALVGAMLEFADPQVARRVGILASKHAEWFTWRGTAERVLAALHGAGDQASGTTRR